MNPAVAVFILICVLFAITWLLRQPSAVRAQTLRQVLWLGGMSAVLLALLSGRISPLIAAMGGALVVLPRLFARFRTPAQPAGGGTSKVSTRFVDMSLDHDSGDMNGTVREGAFSGRQLSQLSLDELLQLLAQCHSDDPQSASVLEAYLDRSQGDSWREHLSAGTQHGQSAAHGSAAMSAEEAREVLGVSTHAGHDEIIAAHRQLMQKLHPDRGGSTYLAAKVNQAKDVLSKQ
ncbi:MAG: hypothetical protein ACI8W7_001027 [Gammaproteobacteria bacterium]|jgi:hypothetical protein